MALPLLNASKSRLVDGVKYLGRERGAHRRDGPRHVVFGRAPVAGADPHAAAATPGDPAEEGVPARVDRGDHLIGPAVVVGLAGVEGGRAEAHQALVQS